MYLWGIKLLATMLTHFLAVVLTRISPFSSDTYLVAAAWKDMAVVENFDVDI